MDLEMSVNANLSGALLVSSGQIPFSDLLAANSNGIVTAYINRPNEFGSYSVEVEDVEKDMDIWASDIESLAGQLGCS